MAEVPPQRVCDGTREPSVTAGTWETYTLLCHCAARHGGSNPPSASLTIAIRSGYAPDATGYRFDSQATVGKQVAPTELQRFPPLTKGDANHSRPQ